MERLYAGAAMWDMTPPKGLHLAGYPHYDRPNTGAHDPLMCACLYLRSGETEIALVTLDILYFSKKFAAQVRRIVTERSGMRGENVLCCCSHTHSGPWAAGNPEMDAQNGKDDDLDPAYAANLVSGIAGTVLAARACAFPASLGVGTVRCGAERGVGGNRRSPDGICDPYLGLVAVKDEAGTLRCLLTNYALHPTFLHEDSDLVSADYPAYLRMALQRRFPGLVTGFAQGCSGDQSSRYFRTAQNFEEARRVGETMAEAAVEGLGRLEWTSEADLAVLSTELPLHLRTYPPSEEIRKDVEKFTAEYERLKAAGAPYLDVQNANLRMLGAEDMLGYALCFEEGRPIALRDDEDPAEIQVFRLGKWAVAGIPGEVFVRYGLQIKDLSPAETTLVFELSNGCLPGYCIDEEALAEGGYEAGNSTLDLRFGTEMAEAAGELAKELFK